MGRLGLRGQRDQQSEHREVRRKVTVIVQLRGGLGNQLFQYAAGYALSKKVSTDLLLDTVLLPESTVDRGGVRRWPEQISSFTHSGQFFDSGRSPGRRRIAQSLAGIERSVGDSRFRGLLGCATYARESFDDVVSFDRLPESSRINAYCNSRRFFSSESSVIAAQVTTLVKPGDWFSATLAEMRVEQPIAIHVRWGDYLNLRHVYGTVAPSYYARAIAQVSRVIGERPIWLFSDDPAGAASFLAPIIALDRVINSPTESTPLENLILLSKAAGLVCANSSFSWWAAFLSSVAPGAVVFPRPLFGETGPPEPKDWLDAEWIQVGRD